MKASPPRTTPSRGLSADKQYILLSRGVGYSSTQKAVWGEAGIPYLLTSEIVVTELPRESQYLTIKPGVTVCLGDGTGSETSRYEAH
jgi:hypothetical protein